MNFPAQHSKPLIASSLLALLLTLFGASTFAQNKKIRVARATEKEVMIYLGISTQVFCFGLEEEVPYEKAGRVAARPVFIAINDLHNRKIAGIKSQLTQEELSRWVDNNILLRATSVCPKLLPEDVLKRLKDFKEEVGGKSKKK